jgi:hypothetical protein
VCPVVFIWEETVYPANLKFCVTFFRKKIIIYLTPGGREHELAKPPFDLSIQKLPLEGKNAVRPGRTGQEQRVHAVDPAWSWSPPTPSTCCMA